MADERLPKEERPQEDDVESASREIPSQSARADEQANEVVVTPKEDRRTEVLDFFMSVLAAFAVILTAYSAYEATRWSGVQATDFATAGSLRSQAAALTTIGAAQVSYDAIIFSQLRVAFRDADIRDPQVRSEVEAFAEPLLRDETKDAFNDWLALRVADGPNAPATPLELPSYHNEELDQADFLVEEAEQSFADARQANQNGDDYILATILFASVLFFTGLQIKTFWTRGLVQGFATLCLLGGAVRLLTLPFE